MKYYVSKVIEGKFDELIEKVTSALNGIGFGVLTTIDVSSTLKTKIDFDLKPYVILGACNPHFASKAIMLEDKLGVLLPCNVVVIDQGQGKIEVAALEPIALMTGIGNNDLLSLAGEVSKKIEYMVLSL